MATTTPTLPGPLPDHALVLRARSGDMTAFAALVEQHAAVVLRVAARIAGRDAAEDVSQEAFLRALHRLGQYRGDAPFRAWLLRIAQNAALDHLERTRRTPTATPLDDGDGEGDGAKQGEPADTDRERLPADSLELAERRARLEEKLRRLSPAHRAVLVLRDLEGLSYEEIATATETPLGSVKGRLHRARRELIDLLRRNTYDWGLPRDDPA